MTEAEWKAWESLKKRGTEPSHLTFDPSVEERYWIITEQDFRAILAADAELTRLREAIEWACAEMNKGNRSVRDWHLTVDELRRRAKEG
jgi:hypothetical protein